MAYATVDDVQERMTREMSADEQSVCSTLLEDAAVLIDAFNPNGDEEARKVVSCRMVVRAIGDGGASVPIGATQGTVSALGYSQSWTIGSGSTGELYLSKVEKKMLGVSGRIGSYSPVEGLMTND